MRRCPLCVHYDAEYAQITDSPGVPVQPLGSFARIVKPIYDAGMYGSKNPFLQRYHKVRTDKDKVAVAQEVSNLVG